MSTTADHFYVGNHKPSTQQNVVQNDVPTFPSSYRHHPDHVQKGRENEVIHSHPTKLEKSSIPDQDPQNLDLHKKRHADVAIDPEQGAMRSAHSGDDPSAHVSFNLYQKYRKFFHLFFFALFTGWWIAGLILHGIRDPLSSNTGWLKPFLLWLGVTLRIIFLYIPVTVLTKPLRWAWDAIGVRFAELLPDRFKLPLSALLVVSVFLIGGFASPEVEDNTRDNRAVSLLGLVVLISALYASSRNRKAVNWHTVIVGMLVQFIVALFVLRTGVGYDIFNFISELARDLLGFANQGTIFLTAESVPSTHWFIITTLPAVIFFVALVQLCFYNGLFQWFIRKFAGFFFWSMQCSGAESVVAVCSPFIGQGESAMLIKPFVEHLTQAELHQVMCSGFATIAGSVLIAYISLGVNAQALVSSCVMSIPASLAISKLRYPETEETLTTGRIVIPDDDDHKAANSLHAFAKGAWLGLKIAGMILSTLLCIIALLGLANGLLTWWGRYLNVNDPPLTVELIVGYICYPIAFLLGIPRNGDLLKVAQLIGTKLVANEFVAYKALQTDPAYSDISPRSRLIATYALCGFANIGSLGTQIGVLSQIAPRRSGDVSRLALSALISGALSTLTSASIAGLLVTDQHAYFTPSAASS